MMRSARRSVLILAALLAAGAAAQTGDGLFGEPPVRQDPGGRAPGGVERAQLIGKPLGRPLTGDALERTTEEIASKMRCPQCQGLSVADSTAPSAMAMKGEVRGFLAAGYTREQILTYFEQAYGEFIRLEPKPEGFNLVVWAAPIVGVLLGVWLVARRLRGRRAAPQAAIDDDLEPYLERVRREVAL